MFVRLGKVQVSVVSAEGCGVESGSFGQGSVRLPGHHSNLKFVESSHVKYFCTTLDNITSLYMVNHINR
jgi:hypothetical protein